MLIREVYGENLEWAWDHWITLDAAAQGAKVVE